MATDYLEALGHVGDIAPGGAAALEYLVEGDYDVVVTDVGMPEMNGFELAERIGELTGGRLPIIALTGWGDTATDPSRPPRYITSILSKPIRLADLERHLRAATGG
ncbi:MAG: response regulator [Gammaproteobacteria bacterium]|nr:response regulator [Gammaproteobacteria bacterium]